MTEGTIKEVMKESSLYCSSQQMIPSTSLTIETVMGWSPRKHGQNNLQIASAVENEALHMPSAVHQSQRNINYMHVNTLVRKSRMQGFILLILPTTNIQQNRFLIDIENQTAKLLPLCAEDRSYNIPRLFQIWTDIAMEKPIQKCPNSQ